MDRSENIKKYYANKHRKEKSLQRLRIERQTSLSIRIWDCSITRINMELKKNNIKRTLSYTEIIGCSPDELLMHLKNSFEGLMSEENYGEWEIDHHIPVSSFNLRNESEMQICFNKNNLKPMWKDENRKKSSKIPTQMP